MSTTTAPRATILTADWAPRMLSIVRIVAALLFMEHGMQKLFGFPTAPFRPDAFSLLWFAAILEFAGGVLVLVGWFTRPVAFLLSGEMAVAYWMAHAPKSPFPAIKGGYAAILFCFVFLYLACAGAGPWSVDGATRRA